jgi:hypothetical protein
MSPQLVAIAVSWTTDGRNVVFFGRNQLTPNELRSHLSPRRIAMATVSPNPSDREIIDGVCGGVITPEKAVELLRGDGDAKLYLLQKLAGGALPVASGVRLEARLAQIAEERAEKRGRGTTASNRLNLKVSAKGALSVYGLQRMPVTLYVEQWERLLAVADDIRKFAQEHTELNRKAMTAVGK